MTDSLSLRHFPSQDPDSLTPKAVESANIARQTAAYEAEHGAVQTLPIRPASKITLTKRQLREKQKRDSFTISTERKKARKMWGSTGVVLG